MMIEASGQILSHAQKLWVAAGGILLVGILLTGVTIPWFRRPPSHPEGHAGEHVQQGQVAGQADPPAAPARKNSTAMFGLFFGKDGRLSTSTTIAWLWTLVIAWGILVLILQWSGFDKAFTHFDGTYFALLGGPYAAYVLARVTVGYKVGKQTLQKPPGDGTPRLSDLVSGDTGNPDLFDMQYVLFNLLAMVFVVDAMCRATADGFPLIPPAMVTLTAGPAAIYTLNKAVSSNGASIFSVSPSMLAAGDQFTVFGENFIAGGDGSKVTVLVNGVAAEVVDRTDTSVTAKAPVLPYSAGGPVQVAVTTPVGAQAVLNNALSVHRPPTLNGLDLTNARADDVVTIEGAWYTDSPLGVVLSWPAGPASQGSAVVARTLDPGHSAQFTVPKITGNAAVTATVKVTQYDQTGADTASLTIAPYPAGQ